MLPLRDNVPTRTFPVVTVGIIAVNVIVWIWEFTGTPVDVDVVHYGYYPCKIDAPCVGPALQAQIPCNRGAARARASSPTGSRRSSSGST